MKNEYRFIYEGTGILTDAFYYDIENLYINWRVIFTEMSETKSLEMPFWLKLTLTIKEAAAYSNIGINKIEELLKQPKCDFVLYVGNKKLVKRKEFEQYISKSVEI